MKTRTFHDNITALTETEHNPKNTKMNCSEHGVLFLGRCICDRGFFARDCSRGMSSHKGL